jgi:hypothetical protein
MRNGLIHMSMLALTTGQEISELHSSSLSGLMSNEEKCVINVHHHLCG